jgi:hypothetical protein
MHALKNWKIPEQLTSDLVALGWISERLPMVFGRGQRHDPANLLWDTQAKVAEQIRLVTAQRSAATLERLSLDDSGGKTAAQIAALEEVLLPKNGAGSVQAAQMDSSPKQAATDLQEQAGGITASGIPIPTIVQPAENAAPLQTMSFSAALPEATQAAAAI